jgi:hypothetical protein
MILDRQQMHEPVDFADVNVTAEPFGNSSMPMQDSFPVHHQELSWTASKRRSATRPCGSSLLTLRNALSMPL